MPRGWGPAWRLLHYQALDGLARGELKLLLQAMEPEPAPVHLLYTARDLAPLKLRKFIDFAAPALRQALLRIAAAVSASRFSAAPLSTARRGQTPPP
jgi:DNA-binding transcriptional LysR family regulator